MFINHGADLNPTLAFCFWPPEECIHSALSSVLASSNSLGKYHSSWMFNFLGRYRIVYLLKLTLLKTAA